MKDNKHINVWHLMKAVDCMEKRHNEDIENLRHIIHTVMANEDAKGQTNLAYIQPGVYDSKTYGVVEQWLLEDRKFKTYHEFVCWSKRITPPIVLDAYYNYSGDRIRYKIIDETAQRCLTK